MQFVTISQADLLLADLNEQQQEAVTSMEGSTVVFAGPGSGKTTVLTRRVLYLLEKGVAPHQMMVVTFTRAAAQEMKERILQIAPQQAKVIPIGTFHSLFLQLLRNIGEPIPRLCSSIDQINWTREWLKQQEHPFDDETISTMLNQIGLCKGNLIYPSQLQVKKSQNILFRDCYQAYELMKQERNLWDFDDILLAVERLTRVPEICEKWQEQFQTILVDEFQDINKVQYEIIKRLASKHQQLFVVGDDDQSIYRFRGSDPAYMLCLREDFPKLKQIVLQVNYRSTEEIIQSSERLIVHNRQRQSKQRVGTGSCGRPLIWLTPTDEEEEAEQIVQMLGDGMETAVLYRTGTQARAMIDALVRKKIPFKADMNDSFYRRWQVQDLLAYLKLAYHPYDLDALVRIINKPKRYLYGEEWMDACWKLSQTHKKPLLEVIPLLPGLKPYQIKGLQELQRCMPKLKKITASEAIEMILQIIGYERYLDTYIKETDTDRMNVWEPIEEIRLVAKHFENGRALLKHVDQVFAMMKQKIDDPFVHLMTFHRAKGLEFDRVCLIGLHAMVLPHRRSLQVADQHKPAAWEEERRLLYVGITRAKREVYLSVSETRQGKKVAPSPFLKELDERFDLKQTTDVVTPLAKPHLFKKAPNSTSSKTKHYSRVQRDQPQLRFATEIVEPDMKILHRKFGEGTIIQVSIIDGVAPGRKIAVRFAGGVQTLHYELARQLHLIDVMH